MAAPGRLCVPDLWGVQGAGRAVRWWLTGSQDECCQFSEEDELEYNAGVGQAVVQLGEGIHALDTRCFFHLGFPPADILFNVFAAI